MKKLTKEEKLLQAIDNLTDAIEELKDEGADPDYIHRHYFTALEANLRELAVLRHTRRQKQMR